MITPTTQSGKKTVEVLPEVTVLFAGDSGDGMQLTGTQFTLSTAFARNDLATLPDFPAEIRAPAGTTYGVSGFQVHFGSHPVYTPGDEVDLLVAMNPAALKMNLHRLRRGGAIIANVDAFERRNLQLAGFDSNPLEDGSLSDYHVFPVPLTTLTRETLKDSGLNQKEIDRSKNMFALGLALWLYSRPLEPVEAWMREKFARRPEILEANLKLLHKGYHFGETTEYFTVRYEVRPAELPPGKYRFIRGNEALALGLVAASQRSGLPLFYGSYPITPASDILHELSRLKHFGVETFQAEDEIAAVSAAIGASFGGAIGVTASSGPGIALKGEAIGLAVMTELPLVIINVQRAGPSTGMPTKTEQADLLQALYGRHGEAPVGVLAISSPGDAFATVYEAVRLAIRYMVPVMVLSDGYIANGAEPWRIPDVEDLPEIPVRFATEPNARRNGEARFLPYVRDPETLSRPWARPGTPGLEHRLGGLEKEHETGNVSYDPQNHEFMVRLRAEKVARMAREFPPTEVFGAKEGKVLVVTWGSTRGAAHAAVERLYLNGASVGHVHLRYLNPLPEDLGDILKRYEQVLVPELNLGQLVHVLRDRYLIPAIGYSKVQGLPFKSSEIEQRIRELL